MKLSEEVEPRLEVVASEPRLDVREPRLLPEEQDRVLAERLQDETQQRTILRLLLNSLCDDTANKNRKRKKITPQETKVSRSCFIFKRNFSREETAESAETKRGERRV